MPVDERARHKLYLAVERELGPENAETLMSLLPPVGWADVATKQDLAQLEARLEAALDARLEAGFREQTRTFVTWLLASQATTVTFVVAAIALFR
jgi:hypothetical protein